MSAVDNKEDQAWAKTLFDALPKKVSKPDYHKLVRSKIEATIKENPTGSVAGESCVWKVLVHTDSFKGVLVDWSEFERDVERAEAELQKAGFAVFSKEGSTQSNGRVNYIELTIIKPNDNDDNDDK